MSVQNDRKKEEKKKKENKEIKRKSESDKAYQQAFLIYLIVLKGGNVTIKAKTSEDENKIASFPNVITIEVKGEEVYSSEKVELQAQKKTLEIDNSNLKTLLEKEKENETVKRTSTHYVEDEKVWKELMEEFDKVKESKESKERNLKWFEILNKAEEKGANGMRKRYYANIKSISFNTLLEYCRESLNYHINSTSSKRTIKTVEWKKLKNYTDDESKLELGREYILELGSYVIDYINSKQKGLNVELDKSLIDYVERQKKETKKKQQIEPQYMNGQEIEYLNQQQTEPQYINGQEIEYLTQQQTEPQYINGQEIEYLTQQQTEPQYMNGQGIEYLTQQQTEPQYINGQEIEHLNQQVTPQRMNEQETVQLQNTQPPEYQNTNKQYVKNEIFIKTYLLGDCCVGKSSLMNCFNHKLFNDQYIMTIGIDFLNKNIDIDDETIVLQIWDISGRMKNEVLKFLRVDCVFLVFDVANEQSFKSLEEWINFANFNGNCPMVVLGNKVDEGKRVITTEQVQLWCQNNGNIPYYEVSAKTGLNVEKAFSETVRKVVEKKKEDGSISFYPSTSNNNCCKNQ